jgi:hypothetical protein
MAGILFATNYDVKEKSGLGPTTVVVAVTGSTPVTQAELNGFVAGVTTQSLPGAGVAAADAFSVAAVGPVGGNTVHVVLQGTGTLGTDAGDYFAGVTAAAVVTFAG